MLKQHNISGLEGKVSEGVLDSYITDYGNLQISSIIAGFHRTFGHRNEGIMMALDIVENIKDDTLSYKERNILVWNLYMLSSEFIDEGVFDKAMEFIKRAERNWSRDILLGDEVGVYHVSWIEQLWQKKAEVYFLIGDNKNFINLSEKIIASRQDLFNKAEEITGETMFLDRCSYSCLDLMAFEIRKYDISEAVKLIKEAISIRSGHRVGDEVLNMNNLDILEKDRLNRIYWRYLKYYYSLHEYPYDSIRYTYCGSCRQFENGKCKIHKLEVEIYKCCSKYRN